MTLLKQFLKQHKSMEEGVRSFAAEMSARYPQLPAETRGPGRQATCQWCIEYSSREDTTTTLTMLPLLLVGLFHFKRSRLDFTTYHYLPSLETNRMRRQYFLKYLLIPLTVLGTVIFGLMLFILGCVTITALLPTHAEKSAPAWLFLCLVILAGLVVAALVKAQRVLRKWGQPPHTVDFADQRVLLRALKID